MPDERGPLVIMPVSPARGAYLNFRRKLGRYAALDHKDGDPLNNDLANLRIVDIRENRRG